MGRKPIEDRSLVKQRLELHLRDGDVELLDLLVRLEGGNRTEVASRAIMLLCERTEALEKLLLFDA